MGQTDGQTDGRIAALLYAPYLWLGNNSYGFSTVRTRYNQTGQQFYKSAALHAIKPVLYSE